MSKIVLLDAGPLGYVTNPRVSPVHLACNEWLTALVDAGVDVRVPEMADYEVRRGLLRVRLHDALERLDTVKASLRYVPLTTEAMLLAARFWADLRNLGFKTADDRALDGDVILAAQAAYIGGIAGVPIVVATDNVKHLEHLCDARQWRAIVPAPPPDPTTPR
jgi:predicted nucleic acid-binding protein